MTNMLPNIPAILAQAEKDITATLGHAYALLNGKGPSDFCIYIVNITVGEQSDSGIDHDKQFEVDLETGILIIQAAQKIIAQRRQEL